MKALVLILTTLLFTCLGLAQEAVVAAVPEVAQPNYLDAILAWIAGAGGLVTSLVIVVEVILRIVPSAKPLSVLIPAQYLIKGLIKILEFVNNLVDKLVEVANRVKPEVKLPAGNKK